MNEFLKALCEKLLKTHKKIEGIAITTLKKLNNFLKIFLPSDDDKISLTLNYTILQRLPRTFRVKIKKYLFFCNSFKISYLGLPFH